jgi:hypothetical protein
MPSQNMQASEARHRVWHDGGEPNSMQTSSIGAALVRGDNALGLELHGVVCAPEVGYLIRCVDGESSREQVVERGLLPEVDRD